MDSGHDIKGRVLVLDDEPTLTNIMERMLNNLGLEVVATGDAHAALAEHMRQPFDVMFVDLWMPDIMHGDEFIDRVRQLNGQDKTIIALITGRSEISLSDLAVDALILKPFGCAEVLKVLQMAKVA
jgi:CheY-like chemotaxis protein